MAIFTDRCYTINSRKSENKWKWEVGHIYICTCWTLVRSYTVSCVDHFLTWQNIRAGMHRCKFVKANMRITNHARQKYSECGIFTVKFYIFCIWKISTYKLGIWEHFEFLDEHFPNDIGISGNHGIQASSPIPETCYLFIWLVTPYWGNTSLIR